MIFAVRLHPAQDAELVRMPPELGQQIHDLGPARAVFPEAPPRAEQLRVLVAAGLAVTARQLRLRVESFHVRRAAAHAEEDYALCRGRKMRGLRREWARGFARCGGRGESG